MSDTPSDKVEAQEETEGSSKASPDQERRTLITWLWRVPVIAALAAAGWGVREAYEVHFNKARPDETPTFVPKTPQRVAPLSDLEEVWRAVPFTLGGTPALALRLPEPVAGGLEVGGNHYAAFSQVCTHLGCLVNLNDDVDAINFAFNYRTEHPALVCPCHLSVFAPLDAGRAVSGPAVEPLPRVQLVVEEGALFAVGIEES